MKSLKSPRHALAFRLDEAEVRLGPSTARFLGRLDEETLRGELERAGVLDALAARGYEGPAILLDEEAGEHRLVVAPRDGSGGESLIEMRMAEGSLPVADPALRSRGVEVLSVLAVHWLSLQDPRAAFTPERSPLPGQTHPGLGLGRRLYAHAIEWAASWGKDALLNSPAYFHNARFFSPPFVFLSPEEQGRFEALVRDLAALSVAEASAAVEAGRVVDESTRDRIAWEPGPMIVPLTAPVRAYLESPAYRDVAASARDSYRFSPPQSSQGQIPRISRKL